MAMPAISTAWASRPWRFTTSSEQRIAAPEPSEVGQHWSLVSGPKICGDSRIWSSVYSSWNWEYGLLVECRWFLWAIFAMWSGVDP